MKVFGRNVVKTNKDGMDIKKEKEMEVQLVLYFQEMERQRW